MSDPETPEGNVGPQRKQTPAKTNTLPGCVIALFLVGLAVVIGGSVILGRTELWWFPYITCAVLFVGPLLTDEPLHRRVSLSIAGGTSVLLSIALLPVFFLLFEWEWYVRHFNDKGSGLLGFFIFTSICVVLPCYGIYTLLNRLFSAADSDFRKADG